MCKLHKKEEIRATCMWPRFSRQMEMHADHAAASSAFCTAAVQLWCYCYKTHLTEDFNCLCRLVEVAINTGLCLL